VRDCEHQSTSTVLYIFALAQYYAHKTAYLNLTALFYCMTHDVTFWRLQVCSVSILLNWNYC